jgi:hypothetical protein
MGERVSEEAGARRCKGGREEEEEIIAGTRSRCLSLLKPIA